ncbi:MAG: hypothetical protein KKH52_03090 [Nanoarchaeota archaeon]|nr:hypothetical protein [Nanoarchaeota archaeon]MBU1622386.1 hypothetical protein [Nanoarchaeota archaeon]MBU1974354.1 hypothetical protein [Nanoarchaeota archaeon]
MRTQTWESLHVFKNPESPDRIKFRDSPLEMPVGVDEVIRQNWDTQLKQKQEQLSKTKIDTEIKVYHLDTSENPLNALYEGDKPKMWPGPVVSLKDVQTSDSGIELLVGQTYFPFIAGSKDEKISKLYNEQEIVKPRPALAICTYALTQDGQLTLTVRGSRTNMYPGRLYGQGGNPLFTNINISEHQADEMRDEILVQPNEYDSNELRFSGIVVDREQLADKPDLVGWVPVNIEAGCIKERVYKRNPDKRPNDAIGVVFAPSTEGELFDYILQKTHPVQYCPPAHGGLVLYGHHNFGSEWSKDLLKKLE